MYLVEAGRLAAELEVADEDPVVLGMSGAGDLVGEIGWLLGTKRSATVRAVDDCRLLEVPAEAFQHLRDHQPEFMNMLSTLIDRRQRWSQRIRSSLPVYDALTAWKRKHRGERAVDVVLIGHPRHLDDMRSTLPWLAALDDDDLRELSRWLRPVFGEILDLGRFSVGLMFLPRMGDEMLDPALRREARRMVEQDCISVARANGATVVCLGALTASLVQYGRRLAKRDDADEMRVTTGHSVTAICCVRTMRAAAQRAGGELAGKRLCVVGVGSVGSAFLRLLCARDDLPKEIVLLDVPAQEKRLKTLVEQLSAQLADRTVISYVLNEGRGALPADSVAYTSELLFTATSIPTWSTSRGSRRGPCWSMTANRTAGRGIQPGNASSATATSSRARRVSSTAPRSAITPTSPSTSSKIAPPVRRTRGAA